MNISANNANNDDTVHDYLEYMDTAFESVITCLCDRYDIEIIPKPIDTGFNENGFVIFHPKTKLFLGLSVPLDSDGDRYDPEDKKGDWEWDYGHDKKHWTPAVFPDLIDAIVVAGAGYWSVRSCQIRRVNCANKT